MSGFVDEVAALRGLGRLARMCLDLAQRPGEELVELVHCRKSPPATWPLPGLLHEITDDALALVSLDVDGGQIDMRERVGHGVSTVRGR
jgi:hypothetical protein